MGQMLASDDNNPNFTGAHDPDSKLAVQFYNKSMQNDFRSLAEKRPIFEDHVFVKIFTPGNSLNVIDTFARDDHKERFPIQWARFQNRQSGDAREVGTPLSAWSRLQPYQVEELRALKFFTVENVANASDANLQSVGMVAGTSPHAFREAAQKFLALAKGEAIASEAEGKLKAIEEERAKDRAQMETMAAQLASLQKLLEQTTAPKAEEPKGEKVKKAA